MEDGSGSAATETVTVGVQNGPESSRTEWVIDSTGRSSVVPPAIVASDGTLQMRIAPTHGRNGRIKERGGAFTNETGRRTPLRPS
jgi:hypothetical protein